MNYETLPDGTKIPVLGLGTWEVGGHMSPDYSQDEQVIDAWKAALEMGYRHIDTAEMYGGGHTEELIGQVIKGFDREDLFITSKVWKTNMHYQDVFNACDASLKRLGTDYLDLYLIHWPVPSVPLDETFEALNELVERGKVKRLGVSNFDLDLLKRARELSTTPLATDQVPYSLFNREYERNGVLDYCQQEGILLTAYTPIEKGRIANQAELQEIAKKFDATAIQVALKWLTQKDKVITIPQSTDKDHLESNLESVEIELSEEDVEKLNGMA